MKRTLLSVALILTAGAALADTKTIGGCQVSQAENGNYYSKAAAGCPIFGEALTDGTPDPQPEPESETGNEAA